jgi:hypothetical protein
MTADQLEIFDVSIMRVLDVNAGRQFGLGVTAIRAHLPTYGFNEPVDAINKRLDYMSDPEVGFVTTVNKGQFNPANVTWKITARGINHLRSIGH